MQNINMALSFNDLVEKVDGWVWGWPLIIIILCAGVWLTVRTGFVQVKHLGKALKFMVKNEDAYKDKDGAYLLASKTETFAKYGGDIMRMTMSATFKKVNLLKDVNKVVNNPLYSCDNYTVNVKLNDNSLCEIS